MTEKELKKSERTRLAILESAHDAFIKRGYDQLGVREIAAGADVTAALVNRYFGSKQGLLKAVLQDDNDYSELYEGPREEMGLRLARFLISGHLTRKSGELLSVNTDRLLIFARSVGCEEALPILREHLAEKITGPLTEALTGGNLEAKASLMMSHFFGFLVIHRVVGAACAVKAKCEAVEELLAASLQTIIDS